MAIILRSVLSVDERDELVVLAGSRFTDGLVAIRARIVLWWDEGRSAGEIAELANVSEPTVRLWPRRYAEGGLSALSGQPRPGKEKQVAPDVRGRALALSRQSPPAGLGVSHWSSRLLADYLTRVEKTPVSHTWVADLWREAGLKPWRQGTFKLSTDPAFAAKVADVVGLYLDPPEGAVVLSVDELGRAGAR